MQALIDFLIRNLLALWPIACVDEWQRAMMVRNGRIHRSLAPGLHWRWLFVERVIQWPASEVVLSLATASITTADGRAIAVDANLGYRLVDIAKNWRTMWSLEKSVVAMAAGIICSNLALRAWEELQGEQRKERERDILVALNATSVGFGVEVVRVHLVACVEARQHRHFVDGTLAR
jgi:regulator of protease activity HflC (stomatin/prohibitin superfamily)